MRLKLFGILGALLVLTACESTPWDAASSSGMGAVNVASDASQRICLMP